MDTTRRVLTLIALIAFLFAVLAGLTWANYRFSEQNPGGNDFLARWMGARYWIKEGISPYDPQVSLATQKAIYGHPAEVANGEDKNHFVYPLTSMIFFAPMALLDYLPARAVWMTLLEVSLFLQTVISLRLVRWSPRPLALALFILFSLLWYHAVRTVIIGQFAGLNALLITLALLSIQQKHDYAAGVLLALATAKPQMVFLLIPFVLLWALSNRRMELFWGTILTSLVLLMASLALMPSWPLQWLGQLLDYPNYTYIGSPLSVIADAMPGIRRSLGTFLHVITLVYLLIEWVLALRKNERWFLWTALLTIVVTNLVAFRTATTNFVMMVPAIFLIFQVWDERWRAIGRWAIGISVLFLGAGLWALFLGTVQGNVEQPVMYLPLPFFCLVGLGWVRWWAIRPPRVLLDDLAGRLD